MLSEPITNINAVCPLDLGWYPELRLTLTLGEVQKVLQTWATNWELQSDAMSTILQPYYRRPEGGWFLLLPWTQTVCAQTNSLTSFSTENHQKYSFMKEIVLTSSFQSRVIALLSGCWEKNMQGHRLPSGPEHWDITASTPEVEESTYTIYCSLGFGWRSTGAMENLSFSWEKAKSACAAQIKRTLEEVSFFLPLVEVRTAEEQVGVTCKRQV